MSGSCVLADNGRIIRRTMANDLKHILGKQIQIKLTSAQKALACTVKNVEDNGLWISGSPLSQMAVQTGFAAIPQQIVIFVPFSSVDWFAMAEE